MIVLGLDASGEGCGAAVVDAPGPRGSAWAGPGGRPAAVLLDLADRALGAAGLQRSALEGVAVAVGPGSYAGIRSAVVTAKALAWAAHLPLVGVGSLQALALAAGPWPGPVWAALDARRGRVYAAAFRWEAQAPEQVTAPALLDRAEFRSALRAQTGACLLVGSGASADDADGLQATLAPPTWGPALPAAVGWLGRRCLLRGERADPFALVPLYVSDPLIGPGPGGRER